MRIKPTFKGNFFLGESLGLPAGNDYNAVVYAVE